MLLIVNKTGYFVIAKLSKFLLTVIKKNDKIELTILTGRQLRMADVLTKIKQKQTAWFQTKNLEFTNDL